MRAMPLPTLSRRIRDSERQFKVQLLARSTRGTKVTDAGTRLYEPASRGIEVLMEAERAVASDQTRLKGRLRPSLPHVFQRCYPDIQVRLFSADRRLDLIEDGIDVALRGRDPDGNWAVGPLRRKPRCPPTACAAAHSTATW
jgi:DNA-binding transcriptional LysR family regulator